MSRDREGNGDNEELDDDDVLGVSTTHARARAGRSSTYVLLRPEGAVVRCWDDQCIASSHPEIDLDPYSFDDVGSFFSARDPYYWLKRALDLTHEGVAQFAFELLKEKVRAARLGMSVKWYVFDCHRWQQRASISHEIMSDSGTLVGMLRKYSATLERAVAESDNHDDADQMEEDGDTESKKMIANISKLIRNLRMRPFAQNIAAVLGEKLMFLDPLFEQRLNTCPTIIVFKNGVFDFRENVFRDGRPDDYMSYTMGCDYVEWASEKINRSDRDQLAHFLESLFPSHTDRTYAMWCFACALDASLDNQLFYIFWGAGSNGKSKLLHLASNAFGDYAVESSVAMLTQRRAASNSATPDIIALKGKRLCTFSELDSGEQLRFGLLKEATGGDKMTGRELYGSLQEFRNFAKFIMSTNEWVNSDQL
ncbi:hypothetical protein HDU93_005087 [Gonapodya sp. JEL0774]|nr:hypothetical protein HDU93_005087 [Gonapodya sp. JEL0774]